MTSSDRRSELQSLLSLLEEADLTLVTRPVVVTGPDRGPQRVTWPRVVVGVGDLYRTPFATVREYREWVESHEYSAVLFDGSLLQLSFDFLGTEVVKHRLVYFPCPFDMDLALLHEEPLLDVIDMYIESEEAEARLVSPLRFDFDLIAQHEGHPASHLTLISSDCRWPVATPLNPGHFVRFVFRHFYPNLFAAHEFLRRWPQDIERRTITIDEEAMLHIACRQTYTPPSLDARRTA